MGLLPLGILSEVVPLWRFVICTSPHSSKTQSSCFSCNCLNPSTATAATAGIFLSCRIDLLVFSIILFNALDEFPFLHSFSTEAFLPDLCNQSKWTGTNFVPSCCFSLVENVLERRLQNFCFQRGAAECSCQHFSMPAVWDELQKLQMRQEQHSPLYLRSRLEQSTLLAAMIAVLAIKFHILGFKSSWYSQYM